MAPEEGTSGSPEPTQSAETPAATDTQNHAAEGTQEAEVDWTPDSLPRDAQGRFSKWVEKTKAEYHRQEITKAGNWIAALPTEDRERVKKDPFLIRKLEAQLEEARRSASGSVGPQNGQPKPEPKDDTEEDAKAFLKEQGWTGQEEGYPAMLQHETARIRFMDKRLAKKAPVFDPDKAVDTVAARLSQKQFQEKLMAVKESPEWNEESLKGATFQGEFTRRGQKLLAEGKAFDPEKLAAEVRSVVFPAAAASKPKPKISLGDTSSGKVSASAETDPLVEHDNRLRAKGIDPSTW